MYLFVGEYIFLSKRMAKCFFRAKHSKDTHNIYMRFI